MTKADIQLVRALADKRGRTEHGLFVAEGEKLIGELRASHLSVRRIFSLEGVFNGPEVETVAPRDMERLSLLKTPSNSLALVEIPRCDLKPERLRGRLTLALDDVQNPGNLGTIIRLADWFGITDIVCSEASADCFNPKVVQATMGGDPPRKGPLHRPRGAAFEGRRAGTSGLRNLSGRSEHLRNRTEAGGHRRDGQRRARNHRRRGPHRHAETLHPALAGRPPGFGIAQRRHGHGHRLW